MSSAEVTRTEQVIDGLDAIVWTATIAGETVAHLDAHTSGLVLMVEVEDDHRGEGLARLLWDTATTERDLLHVPAWGRTFEGHIFAEAMGGDTMDEEQAADILGLDLDIVTGAAFTD